MVTSMHYLYSSTRGTVATTCMSICVEKLVECLTIVLETGGLRPPQNIIVIHCVFSIINQNEIYFCLINLFMPYIQDTATTC